MDSELRKTVAKRLATIEDPELHVDIVSLGLIYNIHIVNKICVVSMSLTYPGCPLGPYFEEKVRSVLHGLEGFTEAKASIIFQPTWKPGMMDPRLRNAYQRA
ncbi:MAG: metal-sulfur cluster assembly factor [Candidatus Nomurabacteria bacterium]|nr:MAG: metal-sulfur cluster assembly factor [Candidatus Nomurabacteria bacterium]